MRKSESFYQGNIRFNEELPHALRQMFPFVAVIIGGWVLGAVVTTIHLTFILLLPLALAIGIAVFRKPHWGLVLLVSLIPAEGVRLLPGSMLSTLPRLAGILLVASLIPRFHVWRLIKDRKNRAIVIFVIALFVSLYAATDLQSGLIRIWSFSSVAIFYAIIIALIRDFVWLKRICLGWIIGASVTAGLALVQMGTGAHLHAITDGTVKGTARVAGFVGDSNSFALAVLAVVPLIFAEILSRKGFYKKLVFLILAPTNLLAMVFSFSRSGFLSLLSMSVLILIRFRHSKLPLVTFIGCALIGAAIIPQEYWDRMSAMLSISTAGNFRRSFPSISARAEILKTTPYVFLESPLIGVGVGNVRDRTMEYSSYLDSPKVAHNMYLEVLLGTGLLGFIPFMLLLWFTWQDLRYVQRVSPGSPLSLYAKGLEISFLTFLVGATFLSIANSKQLWLLFGLSTSLKHIALNEREESNESEDVTTPKSAASH